MLKNLKQDMSRYRKFRGGFHWDEPSWLLIILYRIGVSIRLIRFKPLKIILSFLHLPFYTFFTIILGIQLPRGTRIGGGLRIYHFGCIIVNPDCIIGENCTLRQGVTIGTKNSDHDVPIIGDNVEIGAGAKILGKITIGNNVIIGANAVVLTDIPDDHIAVGIPARSKRKKVT